MILCLSWKSYFTHKVVITIFLIFCSSKYALVVYRWINVLKLHYVTNVIFHLDLYTTPKQFCRLIVIIGSEIQWIRQEVNIFWWLTCTLWFVVNLLIKGCFTVQRVNESECLVTDGKYFLISRSWFSLYYIPNLITCFQSIYFSKTIFTC